MAAKDPSSHSLNPAEAKTLIRRIIEEGLVTYVEPHARKRMSERNISCVDCVNVLRGGIVEGPEWENDAWRYRVRSMAFVVVIEFLSVNELLVVTAWRVEK